MLRDYHVDGVGLDGKLGRCRRGDLSVEVDWLVAIGADDDLGCGEEWTFSCAMNLRS